MTVLASDIFDRANENPLAHGVWTTCSSEVAFQIVSNVATPTSTASTDDGSFYSGIAWPADQFSRAKLTVNSTAGAGAGVGLKVRQASGALTCYRLIVDHAALNNVTIERFVAGVATTVTGYPRTQAWTDGDTWELDVVGTTLRVCRNGVQVGADATDTNIATGSPGIGLSTTVTSASINDWEGGDFINLKKSGLPLSPQQRSCP